MTGTRLPDERAQAVRSLGSLLNHPFKDDSNRLDLIDSTKVSKNLTRDVGESRVSEGALSDQLLYIFYGLFRRLIVQAAWTRRSRSEAAKRPNRESWKQRTDTHMRPFLLNVFFYRKFIHAKVMHRPTRKVISVATTNARNIRINIPQAHS
uniref:Uncharacterized protein n=1 Tax=Brassica oleracea TaxID=3712 RepID=A0A3P6EKI5_BRAOL|nr:unnamed protein product [Brassica oleracea]